MAKAEWNEDNSSSDEEIDLSYLRKNRSSSRVGQEVPLVVAAAAAAAEDRGEDCGEALEEKEDEEDEEDVGSQ